MPSTATVSPRSSTSPPTSIAVSVSVSSVISGNSARVSGAVASVCVNVST
ncbi:MAG: hypothetical protein IJ305_03840 [Oscillospiraceae bacterium]|nr:hypothetical protein [Oscillospiraceae bacterium]